MYMDPQQTERGRTDASQRSELGDIYVEWQLAVKGYTDNSDATADPS